LHFCLAETKGFGYPGGATVNLSALIRANRRRLGGRTVDRAMKGARMRHFMHRVTSVGLAGVFIAAVSGCSGTISMLALPALFTGSEAIEPKVKLVKGRHDSAKILVLSFASTDLRWGNDSVDEEITAMISAEISQDSRFKVTPERKVRAWKDLNPRWSTKSPQAIGEEFEVDYVVMLEVTDFAVQEPKSPFLLQGRAKASIKVHDVKKDQEVYRDIYTREFPSTGPIPASDISSQDGFKIKFMKTLAKELSWTFVAHPASDVTHDPF
jgi:hypothetical protein